MKTTTNPAVKIAKQEVKQAVLGFKKGEVTIGHNFGGEIEVKHFKENELKFKTGTTDANMPNSVYMLNNLLEVIIAEIKEAKEKKKMPARYKIAVPSSVSQLANNMEIMTELCWTDQMAYDIKNLYGRITLVHAKLANRRALVNGEKQIYRELLNNIKLATGHVIIKDSSYVPLNHKEDETEEQATWCEINQKIKDLREGHKAPQVVNGDDDYYIPDEDPNY